MSIQKVAVIGAGVMGAAIAAHCANAGVEVRLLDIVPDDAEDRNKLAKDAIEKMKKDDPAPFMNKQAPSLITPGNIEDNMKDISDCDWIVEAVVENLDIKHKTYANIEKHRKPDAITSSNTSTIPIKDLIEGRAADFQSHFVITHFFNPPRYMRLLELVTSNKTSDRVEQRITDFCDRQLGKGVVKCHDRPAFIANRLLVFFLQACINEKFNHDIPIELADAVLSKPVGIPKTGVFGLIDLVGIDLMPHLADSLKSRLPKKDFYQRIYKDYPFVQEMIDAGYTGRKGKGGFYRLDPDAEGKVKQALRIDPGSFDESQYEKATKPKPNSASVKNLDIREVITTDDEGGKYAWSVLRQTLTYAASLVPEIADDIYSVDRAMQLGCNWKLGPFEMLDKISPAWFAQKLMSEGKEIPELLKKVGDGKFYKVIEGRKHYFGLDGQYRPIERPDGVLLLEDIKLQGKPVLSSSSASIWDIGDGVLCLEFTGKMNALDFDVFDLIQKAVVKIGDGDGLYKGLVIYNEGSHFSAGANLGLALGAIHMGLWHMIEEIVNAGQRAYRALKFANFPVVAAPSGMALGGGCEALLHADHIQAHAETYTGLVEAGVGLIPGWGGCKEVLLRFREREAREYKDNTQGESFWMSPQNSPMTATRRALEVIGKAEVAKSAHEAKRIGYFRDTDGVTMNRDRLLFEAKHKVLEMAPEYKPPEKVTNMRLAGPSGMCGVNLSIKDMHAAGKITDYDVVVTKAMGYVLTGGHEADVTVDMDEDDLLELEKDKFITLVKRSGTLARIEHMLFKGKPLRN